MSRYREGFGAAAADLVAPTVTQGAAQRLDPGSTSAAVTVNSASGGTGSFVYGSPSLDAPGGSSAAVSGTAPGALSVTGLADGEAVVVSGTVTDSGSGQIVSWSHTVAVAASGGGGSATSELLAIWDFRDADNGAISGTGNITENSGADVITAYKVFVQQGTFTNVATEITDDGLRLARSNGNSISGVTFPMSTVFSSADSARDTFLFFVYFASIANSGMLANQNLNVVAAKDDASMNVTPTRGLFLHNTSATELGVKVREYDGAAVNVTQRVYGSSWPSSGTALVEMSGSRVFAGWSDGSAPARSAVAVGNAGISSTGTAPSSSPPATPFAHLLIALNPRDTSEIDVTISHIEIYRLSSGAS